MKAILVVDIPDDYQEYGDWYVIGADLRIVYEEDGALMNYKYIDDDMPQLKPMPLKLAENFGSNAPTNTYIMNGTERQYLDMFAVGYNRCIDEIVGG